MKIGPHEGKELELMLAGQKQLAAFGDIIPKHGSIPEYIIPEQKFAPYIKEGTFIRFENITDTNHGMLKHVCFTPPKEAWRAKTYLWLREQITLKTLKYEDAHDWIFGRLLGYSDQDIQLFLRK